MIEICKLAWVYVRDDVLMKWCFLNYDLIDQYYIYLLFNEMPMYSWSSNNQKQDNW